MIDTQRIYYSFAIKLNYSCRALRNNKKLRMSITSDYKNRIQIEQRMKSLKREQYAYLKTVTRLDFKNYYTESKTGY